MDSAERRSLEWNMLTALERETYAYLSAAEEAERVDTNEHRRNEQYAKMASLGSLFSPVKMIVHGTKAVYYGVLMMRDLYREMNGHYRELPQRDRRLKFVEELLVKYGCDAVDWDSFPS